MKKIIAVLGDAEIEQGSFKEKFAFATGKIIIDAGFRLQCGGLYGVMEAACKGAHASKNYHDGDVIGILPSFDPANCNAYVDIPIATGLDFYRNIIVANACACIAIGGGSGTLSEIASAWAMKRMIIAFNNCGGSGEKVADTRLDSRIRYPELPDDKIFAVNSPDEIPRLLKQYLPFYDKFHKGITL